MEDQSLSKRPAAFFTTINPVSKFLALLMLIVFPFVGFYLGIRYQQAIAPIPNATNLISKVPKVLPTVSPPAKPYSARDAVNTDFLPNFVKLSNVTLSMKAPEMYYTSLTLGCAGAGSLGRKLPAEYLTYLERVGETSDGKLVYILTSNFPLPNDTDSAKQKLDFNSTFVNISFDPQKFDGDIAHQGVYGKSDVFIKNWNSFLLKQKVNFPILIIKDLNNYTMYVREDYFQPPQC